MTVETALFDLLKGLVTDQVYPDTAPTPLPARPYITFQQIGGKSKRFLDGGIPSKRNVRMQLNWWCDTRLAASALGKQIEDALAAATTLTAEPLSEATSLHEEDLSLYGAQQDWSIWIDR